MATRYAVATGNWSAVGTWDGGAALPGAGDTVHADGYTVTIDQTINVGSLRTTQRAGGTAGGGFTVAAGGYTLTLTDATSGLWTGTTDVLTHSATSGTTTITGIVYNNGATSSTVCLKVTGAGATVNVTGNVTGGGSGGRIGITVAANSTVNVTGNVTTSNSSTNAHAIRLTATCTLTVTGNVTQGSGNQDFPLIASAGTPTVTITGTITAAASGTPVCISFDVAGTLTVNGPIMGGTGAAVSSNAAATITVADVTAGTAEGVTATGSCTIIATGTITASSGTAAISSSGASSVVRLSGNLVDASGTGQQAIYARRVEGNWSGAKYHRFRKYTGGTVDLVTTASLTGLPAAGDVRNGTTYGATSEFTGTLVVPSPTYVLAGVPTDNTVGSATASADPAAIAAAVWDYLTADADTSGSMGLRLRDAASVDSTGAQLAALGA